MEIRPILSTLMRHKIAALLIVLEIALTCAIVCNALFLIGERLDRMNKPSGIAENELVRIQAASLRQLSGDDDLNKSVTREYLDVLRKVREDERTKTVPVILLTARSRDSDVDSGFATGATDYVIKPFSPRELVHRVSSVLARGA